MIELVGLVLGIIGTSAACIAAVPVVKSWLPVFTSDNEKKILKLAISNPRFNGIIEYNLEPNSIVKSPFIHNEVIEVSTELLELRDKGLIQLLEGSFGQPYGSVWFQLTRKGYSLAKRQP